MCQFHLHSHKVFELKPSSILTLFNQLDVWRKPQEFEDFLIACEADAKGRLGFEVKSYPQANFLRLAANKCLKLSAKNLSNKLYMGNLLKKALI